MDLLYSVFFGAGVAAFVYSKMGKRIGYGNTANVWTVVGVVFIFATIFFLTLMKFILNF
jgi:hypothetical protein